VGRRGQFVEVRVTQALLEKRRDRWGQFMEVRVTEALLEKVAPRRPWDLPRAGRRLPSNADGRLTQTRDGDGNPAFTYFYCAT
jgi:hypothetical protein